MDTITLKLNGVSPILMHNGRLADPMDDFTLAIKNISSKRSKTEDDHAELGRLEWWAGLYTSKTITCTKSGQVDFPAGAVPVLPAWTLTKALILGARKVKLGKQFEAGVLVEDDCPLDCPGLKSLDKIELDGSFTHRCATGVAGKKVMRTRPMFQNWTCIVPVTFDEQIVDPDAVVNAAPNAGRLVGIGDWRPRFGRFTVEAC